MSQITLEDDREVMNAKKDIDGNVIWGIKRIGSGTSAYTMLILCQANTSYYIWVDTTGDLRISTTAPTTSTTDSAGSVVGSQS